MRRGVFILAGCLLAACGGEAPPEDQTATGSGGPPRSIPGELPPSRTDTASADVRLTADGLGPVRIGMTEAEAAKALGAGVQGVTGEAADCHFIHTGSVPAPILYMVEDGRLSRITLNDASQRTDRGLTVGATAAEVRTAYGAALQAEPHKYSDAPAEYLTAWVTPEVRGIRYVVGTDGRVEQIHAGDESIRLVEGCS